MIRGLIHGSLGRWCPTVTSSETVREMSGQGETVSAAAEWTKCKDGGPERWRHAAVAFGAGIYVLGGYGPGSHSKLSVHLFNTSNMTWMDLTEKTRRGEERHLPPRLISPSAVVFENKILVWGGFSDTKSKDLYIFHTSTLTWEKPEMEGHAPRGRDEHSCCVIGKHMYVFSGIKLENYSADKWTDLHYLDLDPSGYKWNTVFLDLPEFPNDQRKELHVAIALDNKLYIFGSSGNYLPFVRFKRFVTFDTDNEQTTSAVTTTNHPCRRRGSAVWAYKGHIWVCGGKQDVTNTRLNDLHYLEIAKTQWTQVKIGDTFPEPTIYHCACVKDGKLFVIGGRAVEPHFAIAQTWYRQLENTQPTLTSNDSDRKTFLDSLIRNELSTFMDDKELSGPIDVRKISKEDRQMIRLFNTGQMDEDENVGPVWTSVYRIMRHPKGRAVILNNMSFQHMPQRAGSQKDAADLTRLFQGLGLCVVNYEDKTCADMEELLKKEICSDAHSNYDCFVLVVLSHGDRDVMFGIDSDGNMATDGSPTLAVTEDYIYDLLASSEHLKDKPKMLFIQACRGSRIERRRKTSQLRERYQNTSKDATVEEQQPSSVTDPPPHSPPASASPYPLPSPTQPHIPGGISPHIDPQAVKAGVQLELPGEPEEMDIDENPLEHKDVFTAHATRFGYTAFRDANRGSWFVQAMVYVFSKLAYKKNLFDLMTIINQLVNQMESNGNAQVTEFKSTFSKNFYFFPGLPESRSDAR